MKFTQQTAEIFIPDGIDETKALSRTTCMCVGAHQDDLEIMALPAILDAYQQTDRWFCGVVATDGKGSPRMGKYACFTSAQMQEVRHKEQRKAAVVGEYGSLVLLNHTSIDVKQKKASTLESDLSALFQATTPQLVYTHNLVDKHPTHVAVAIKVVQTLRSLPKENQPKRLLGCEVWRSLDWLSDKDKVVLDCSENENLRNALIGLFDSQISGGKRYDLATFARQKANATYYDSHGVDTRSAIEYAMDLTPLLTQPKLNCRQFIQEHLSRFSQDVLDTLDAFS